MLNISLRSAHPTPVRNYVAQPIPPPSANEILHRRRKPSSTRFPFGNTPNRDNPRCPAHYAPLGQKNPVQTGQMRKKGVEPIHPNREQEPESCASTNFATFAYEKQCKTTATTNRRRHALYPRTTPYASFFCLSALFAAFLPRSMSLSLHTSFFFGGGRSLYVAIAPYELGGHPIGKADTGRLQLRYCPQAANTLRYRPIACGNTGSVARSMSLSLHTSFGGGPSRCCRRQKLLRAR